MAAAATPVLARSIGRLLRPTGYALTEDEWPSIAPSARRIHLDASPADLLRINAIIASEAKRSRAVGRSLPPLGGGSGRIATPRDV
jgi:hypothetical protein